MGRIAEDKMPPRLLAPAIVATALLLASTSLVRSTSALAAPPVPAAIPSWDRLRSLLPEPPVRPPPVYRDGLPEDYYRRRDDDGGAQHRQLPILYRDGNCVDVASETVWLALECKNVAHVTVLVFSVEEEEEDSTSSNVVVPRIIWPDDDKYDDDDDDNARSLAETDPIRLLEQIQSHYPDDFPNFYPRVSAAVDASRCNIMRLPGIMPRYTDPRYASSAPYIFRDDDGKSLVKRSSHAVTLEEIEEMQEEYDQGPYLCGRDVSAADMVWAPYLERYAVQLPLMFPNAGDCNPKSKSYGGVRKWYSAMEKSVPAYACRVRGDARHWRRCLERATRERSAEGGGGVDDFDGVSVPAAPDAFGWWMEDCPRAEELWGEYARGGRRPWLAETPGREMASYLMNNRDAAIAAATSSTSSVADMRRDDADEALREIVRLLLDWKVNDSDDPTGINVEDRGMLLSENALRLARFVCEEVIEVPRTMGMIPALALGGLVRSALSRKKATVETSQ